MQVSTQDKNTQTQVIALEEAQCGLIFHEQENQKRNDLTSEK